MEKLKKYRKNLIITLSVLLVLMVSVGLVYGKFTSSRMSVVSLTLKHTVTLTLDANLPEGKTSLKENISTTPVVLTEEGTGDAAQVIYPTLPADKLNTDDVDKLGGEFLDGYYLEGWYLDKACTDGKEVKANQKITVEKEGKLATEVTLYAKWKKVELQELGGEIFYIDPDVNGALYKFYKEEESKKVEITDWNSGTDAEKLEKLKDAKYYIALGSNTDTTNEDPAKNYKTDKFYVVAADTSSIKTLATGKWDAASLEKTEDGIGKGKSNTKSVMDKIKIENPDAPYPTDSIWNSLYTFMKPDTVTNKDWYIGSKEEMKKLHAYCADKEYTHFDILSWWTSTKTKYTDPEVSKVSFWNIDKGTDDKWDETESGTASYSAIPMRSF